MRAIALSLACFAGVCLVMMRGRANGGPSVRGAVFRRLLQAAAGDSAMQPPRPPPGPGREGVADRTPRGTSEVGGHLPFIRAEMAHTQTMGADASLPRLFTTALGWNRPNETDGLRFCRTIAAKKYWDAVEAHPRRGGAEIDVSRPSYIFLDFDTTNEHNWPVYGGGERNYDGANGRPRRFSNPERACPGVASCDAVTHAEVRTRESTKRSEVSWHAESTVVVFAHGTDGRESCFNNEHVVNAGEDFPDNQGLRRGIDISIAPLPVTPMTLSEAELRAVLDVDACARKGKRKYLLSFSGAMSRGSEVGHPIRMNLQEYAKRPENTADMLVKNAGEMLEALGPSYNVSTGFHFLLHEASEFSAAPRGTNLFSYRFTEILSAGAIPVVYADNWMLPLEDLLVYDEFAVVIPEKDVNQTREILEAIPLRKRCEMRRNALHIYKRFMQSPGHALRAVMTILDGRRRKQRPPNDGDDGAGRIGKLETEVGSIKTELTDVNGKLDAILNALTQKGN